jgi:hypothetical protein
MASRPLRRCAVLATVGVFAGCFSPPDAPPQLRVGGLEPTALVLQAVDAGTGSALADAEMTVRYLVRAPIAFDASAVDQVRSVEPYRIEMPVGEENLVLEVRLEADSYHRLDTVFSVPRGSSAGPLTVRLSPRLGRVAEAAGPATASSGGSLPRANSTPLPGPAVAGSEPDRGPMTAGDRAFRDNSWLSATEAYERMPAPGDDLDAYGRDYLDAKVRQGIAHINRSEYGRALEVLEEAVDMREPTADAYLRLAQSQCAVGRSEEGVGTLAQVGRMRNRLLPEEQSRVSALMSYHRGVCGHLDFERAEATRDRVRAGAQATQELNAFIEGARAMSPVPPEVYAAVQDAERRVAEIRRAMGGGRGG